MAIEKVVKIRGEGFDKLIKQTADLQKEEQALNKELSKLEKGTESYVKKQLELTQTQEKLSKSTDELKNANKGVFGSILSAFPNVEKGFNGLKTGFKGAISGANGLKTALIATGIPIIIGAVVLLTDKFKEMQPVLDFIEDTFSSIGQVGAQVFSALTKLMKGDFAGALEDVTTGIKDGVKEVKNLNQAVRDLDAAERENIVTKAQTNALIAKNKLLVQDANLSTEEKLKLIDEAIAAEEKQLVVELNIAKERFKVRQQQLKLQTRGRELNDEEVKELRELEAAVIDLETTSFQKRTELAGQRKGFIEQTAREEEAAQKQRQARAEQLTKEGLEREKRNRDRRSKLIEDDLTREITQLTDKYNDEIALAKERGDDLLLIEEEFQRNLKVIRDGYAMQEIEAREIEFKTSTTNRKLRGAVEIEEEKGVEKTITEIKAGELNERLSLAIQATELAGQLFEESKGVQIAGLVTGQAAGIVQIVQNTAGAIARATAELGIASPPYIAALKIGAGLSIATMVAKTAKGISDIKSAKPSGGSSSSGGGSIGGGTIGGGSISTPTAPAQVGESTIFNQQELFGSAEERFGGGQGQTQIKAVVSERDVTDTQRRINTFEERSSLN